MHPALRDILESSGPNRLELDFPGTVLDMFENDHPIEIEIGAGKGRFALGRALAEPNRNIIAIDYVWKYLKRGWARARKRGISNTLFFKAEASEVVTHLVPDNSVRIFHIYFPDPWQKRKHQKRRLLTPDFFRLLYRRLEPGGLLEIATDNFDYMIAFKAALVEAGDIPWAAIREQRNHRIMNPELRTNFELKYERAGRDLYYMELQK